jgi:hypothetical protein
MINDTSRKLEDVTTIDDDPEEGGADPFGGTDRFGEW